MGSQQSGKNPNATNPAVVLLAAKELSQKEKRALAQERMRRTADLNSKLEELGIVQDIDVYLKKGASSR